MFTRSSFNKCSEKTLELLQSRVGLEYNEKSDIILYNFIYNKRKCSKYEY